MNQTVKLPRWRRLASYSRQFVTLRFCRGIWRRRSWFCLKGTLGIRGAGEGSSCYSGSTCSATGRIHATRPHPVVTPDPQLVAGWRRLPQPRARHERPQNQRRGLMRHRTTSLTNTEADKRLKLLGCSPVSFWIQATRSLYGRVWVKRSRRGGPNSTIGGQN